MSAEVDVVEGLRIAIVRWLSPADAVAHIEAAADCDRNAANDRMRSAIADGHLGVRWSDEEGENDKPPGGSFWKVASIRLDHGGEVLLQFLKKKLIKIGEAHSLVQHEGPPRFRGFVVNRDDLYALWPTAEESAQPARAEASVVRPIMQAIRDSARHIYGAHANDPPNMNEAERLLREGLPRAGRGRLRAVLREPEFAQQRRRSGHRRRR